MKYRIALLSTIVTLAAASMAEAQTVVTYPAPTTTYYAPARANPVTTYYAPAVSTPVVPAPATTYYAPAATPVTTYAPAAVTPVTTYSAVPVVYAPPWSCGQRCTSRANRFATCCGRSLRSGIADSRPEQTPCERDAIGGARLRLGVSTAR